MRFFEMPARQSELVPFRNCDLGLSITRDTAEIASILREIRGLIGDQDHA